MESHVLPAFLFRWLRGRSGTSHIRNTETPNKRVQDGIKFPWLCARCEGMFNNYETQFATQLFHPWTNGKLTVSYDEWLLKFCVSISWRILKFAKGQNESTTYTLEQEQRMITAEKVWRDFLNGEVVHPGEYEQHLLFFDSVESTDIPNLPHNFNRFMSGAITLDIVGSDSSVMTFAKMGPITLFGIIQKGNNKWKNTRVCVKKGVIKPDKFVVPHGLIDLFKEKAEISEMALSKMSENQKDKIDRVIENDLDAFANSKEFKAIRADAEMFGVDAVIRKKK